MIIIKNLFLILIGLGSGVIISGAVFAFIAMIGIVPRLADKTDTANKIKLYEEAIILGGIFGAAEIYFNYSLPIGNIPVIILSLLIGMFTGCLAVSLAEVLNVIPILIRRSNIVNGLKYFVLAIAIGKLVGSIIYFFIEGFYHL